MRKNPNLTKLFKGFRVGKRTHFKLNLKFLEKQKVLTDLQHNVVELNLERCAEKNSSPEFVARLVDLLERPIAKAKVDQCGNKLPEQEKENKQNDS